MVLNTNATNSTLTLGNYTNSSKVNSFVLRQTFDATTIIILVLQIVVFLVGTVGNVFVCIVTSRKRNLKIVGNRFILNLAIADLGVLLISYPIYISREFSLSWPFGEFVCKTLYPFTDMFFGVGIGSITAIALHRYRMLVHCMKPQMNVQMAKRILFFIWLLSFFIVVMPLFFVMELKNIPKVGIWICEPRWPRKLSSQMYHTTIVFAFYFAPLSIISLTYIRIRTKLKDSIRKHDSYRRSSFKEEPSRKETVSRIVQNRRALRLLAPVVVVFTVCMAPVNFLTLVIVFVNIRPSEHFATALRFFTLLLITNASANPLIYSVVNSDFRRDFMQLLRCDTDGCCADTTEGLSLTTFRRSSSSFSRRSKERKRSSFLLDRRRSSSSSFRKSSRNSAEKLQVKTGDGSAEGKGDKRVDG